MITIKIATFNSQPSAQPVHCEFDEMGGTIGRADGNTLVLPDPERHVSRTHAMIVFRSGGYILRDLSSTSPVHVNGQPLGNGREAKLADGDEIKIGRYMLQVLAQMPNPAQTAPLPNAMPRDDPLAMFGQPSVDPFADLLAPGVPAPTARYPAGAYRDRNAPLGGRQTIPTGFDPFADLMAPPPSAYPLNDLKNPARLPDNFNLGLEPASSHNIDQLFGLDSSKSADPFGAGHPLSDPSRSTERSSSLDPLVAMGAAPVPSPAPGTQRDDSPEIHAAFIPPAVFFNEGKPAAVMQPSSTTPPTDPSSMLFSWSSPNDATADGDIKSVIVPSPRQAAQVEPRNQVALPALVNHQPDHAARPQSAPSPQTAVSRMNPASQDELLSAFLAGAGVSDLDMHGPLTPQTMSMIGQLLRASTQGTLDLLLARALIKREVRAEVTMILARENNPLKFSPNVEVALSHLLAPRGQGFMSPVVAVKDAYDDLRAHQFGFMAGMRAALDGVLRRFDPAQLELRLTDKNIIDSMLPMNRKAKLWSLFIELYSDITKEAQDDFQSLFGKEFLRAYESQLEKLQKPECNASAADKT
ncbi:type VI secretion system-associated FHA domain protein TagH [Polaromonas glacialis]|uniref:type VI secretion system-associated FHA domain protein TagH n=1 Tax=Polaromonas glacialis TaxID=866564 RepID=UPI000A018131|nr:type VI secretion system-associated FHA domain protein TagH [Polaromonas glacialis]